MRKWLALMGCFFSSALWSAELPYPYNTLREVLPFNPHTLYRNDVMIMHLVKEYDVSVIVELGSWLGASTRHFAMVLPPEGMVYAVDHWLGSAEHQIRDYKPLLSVLYQQFLSNTIHAGLTDKIIPIKMPTTEAALWFKTLRIRPDLIYVDASHDEENVYRDLSDWYPLIKGHGVICGDDWDWKGVEKAVTRFAKQNNLQIENYGIGWALRDPTLIKEVQ
jgi:predicted O-methyltransferase YrrM